MRKLTLLTLIVTLVVAISCSKDSTNKTASEFLSSYMKDNKSVVMFGKMDMKSILEKADYKKIPKVSVLLNSEMKDYENSVDLAQGINFAMEGPFEKDGKPARIVAFVKVKNADSLANKIGSLGMMMEKSGDMKFSQDNDVSIGIKENLAIILLKSGKYDGKSELDAAFKKCESDVSEGKVDQILAEKKDILLAISMENLYASSNTSISNLDEAKKKEFEALVKDSYIQSTVSFDKGKAVFETKNMFSSALSSRMFLKDDKSASILKKLGKGNARIGLTMNLDIQKMESFMDDFAPEFKRQLSKSNFQLQMAMSTLGDKPFTNLLSGKIGMVMVGDMMKDGSLVPEANIHLGFGKKGKEVSEMMKAFFPQDGKLYGMNAKIDQNEISIFSGKTTESSLIIPSFAANFGTKGITAFVNFDGMELESMDLQEGAKMLYAFQNMTMEVDNNGSQIIITAKNQNQNILKSIIDVYLRDIEKTIGAIN